MGDRSLRRCIIDPLLLKRLDVQEITTAKELLQLSPLEVLNILGSASLDEPLQLLSSVSALIAPPSVTAYDLYNGREGGWLRTTLVSLDSCLLGGLRGGTITEVAGPAGCGKTQFCSMLAVVASLPASLGGLDGGALYIDTEGAVSALRFAEIARCRFPEYMTQEQVLSEHLSRIYIQKATTVNSFMSVLEKLQEEIIENNIKLVIVDSIASLIRKEVEHNTTSRSALLLKQAATLKEVAEGFSIPVLVTNQVQTVFSTPDTITDSKLVMHSHDGDADVDSHRSSATGDDGYVTIALGMTWTHCMNTRLILQFADDKRRQLLVAKSPSSAFRSFEFVIDESGITFTDPANEGREYLGGDPRMQKIQTRVLSLD